MIRKNLKTLSIVAQKGGTGKTTLAVNLAVLAAIDGLRVALIDCDPQQSAAGWWQARETDGIDLIEGGVNDIPKLQTALQNNGFDLLIIDTRPSVEAETSAAIQAATVCIIPTRPGVLDLRAVASTSALVKSAKASGCIVLNQCPPPRQQGSEPTLTAEVRAVASTLGLPVAPPAISMRAAFSYSLNDGRGVCEYEAEGKASQEIRNLWHYIQKAYLNG